MGEQQRKRQQAFDEKKSKSVHRPPLILRETGFTVGEAMWWHLLRQSVQAVTPDNRRIWALDGA
jgi:hypothetical protein